jgi:hypothetical protein
VVDGCADVCSFVCCALVDAKISIRDTLAAINFTAFTAVIFRFVLTYCYLICVFYCVLHYISAVYGCTIVHVHCTML